MNLFAHRPPSLHKAIAGRALTGLLLQDNSLLLRFVDATLPPRVVRREVCPVHGLSRDLWEKEGVVCHCDDTLGILVMPLAEAADQDRVESEGEAIDEQVDVLVWDKFGLYTERSPANFVEYQGKLLACDFGIPDFDYW